jgi:Pvc16 N-terminal domain
VLDLIDTSLEAFFRATVPLSAQDVDVSFEPPDRDWSAKLTRPTVNLFLRDIRHSAARSRSGVEEIEREGRLVRRMALPRVELRYLVTAWTSDHGDERALLSGLMRALLAHGEIPAPFVADGLRHQPSPRILMARSTDDRADMSASVDSQLKPGIDMMVVSDVDTDVYTPAGPPVAVFEARLSAIGDGVHDAFAVRRVAGEVADAAAVGVAVISPCGSTTVNTAGRFVIAARAGDEIVVETEPPRAVVVPVEGGVRVT